MLFKPSLLGSSTHNCQNRTVHGSGQNDTNLLMNRFWKRIGDESYDSRFDTQFTIHVILEIVVSDKFGTIFTSFYGYKSKDITL